MLAGFRAATGRNGLIRKRAYYVAAMRRGLAVAAAVLGGLGLVLGGVLAVAADSGARYASLTQAGTTMLWIVGPFAGIVGLSLVGYAVLPRRPATFLILLGLGPFTLVRPWVTMAAGLVTAGTATDLTTAACAMLAAGSVLAVEPVVHRRWYTEPA